MAKKVTTDEKFAQEIQELTLDLQRTRADFENYRKNTDENIARARAGGEAKIIREILPLIDLIEAALAQIPPEIAQNSWVQGIAALKPKLAKILSDMKIRQIPAQIGDAFDHEIHNAISIDEDSSGENDVVAEILQNGYFYQENVLRPTMVRVKKQ